METSIGAELYRMAGKDHPLTKYIIEIDRNISDDSVLRSIAERIGIYVPDNENAIYVLYDELKKRLIEKSITLEKINSMEYI